MVISPREAANLKVPGLAAAQAAAAAPAAPAAGAPAPLTNGVLPKARLQVLSGQFAGRELELVKTLTTLGRPGVQVAAITRRADGYYIVHVESAREGDYPLVNGAAIGPQARRLHDNDVIAARGREDGVLRRTEAEGCGPTWAALLHLVVHALADATDELVGDRPGVPRDLLDRHALAPQHHRIGRGHAGQVGDIHRDHVHRDAPDQRRAVAVHQHGRT